MSDETFAIDGEGRVVANAEPSTIFRSSSMVVKGEGWVIMGRPRLRSLLRYWWKTGRKL